MSEFQKREDCNAVFARGHWVRQNERRFGMESFFSSSVDLPAVETGNSARVYFLAKVVFSFSWVFEVGNGKEGADFGLSCCDRLGNASYLLFNGTLCLTRGLEGKQKQMVVERKKKTLATHESTYRMRRLGTPSTGLCGPFLSYWLFKKSFTAGKWAWMESGIYCCVMALWPVSFFFKKFGLFWSGHMKYCSLKQSYKIKIRSLFYKCPEFNTAGTLPLTSANVFYLAVRVCAT